MCLFCQWWGWPVILFLLDEFAALGKVDAFKEGMATVRSRGINIWAIVQSQAQLEELYGPEGSRMIREQASAVQVFGAEDPASLQLLRVRTKRDLICRA